MLIVFAEQKELLDLGVIGLCTCWDKKLKHILITVLSEAAHTVGTCACNFTSRRHHHHHHQRIVVTIIVNYHIYRPIFGFFFS